MTLWPFCLMAAVGHIQENVGKIYSNIERVGGSLAGFDDYVSCGFPGLRIVALTRSRHLKTVDSGGGSSDLGYLEFRATSLL